MLDYGCMSDWHPRIEHVLRKVIEHQSTTEKINYPLQKLKRVFLANDIEEYFPDMAVPIFQVLPCLALESVQEVSCHRLAGRTFPYPDFGWPGQVLGSIYCTQRPKSRFSKTSLSMKHSFTSSDELSQFLGLFQSIKRLECDFKYNDNPSDDLVVDDMDFAPTQFCDAIAHLEDSLEELILTEDQYLETIVDPEVSHNIIST